MSKSLPFPIYKKLTNDELARSDFQLLLKICREIAKTYIFRRGKSLNFGEFVNNNLDDLSVEIIEPLFLKNQIDGKLELIRSFEHLNIEINTESQFTYILHKIIWHRAEQHITKILKDQDPVFARILKNLHYLIKKYNYNKESYFGKAFIVRNDTEKIDYKVINEDAFNQLPVELISIKTGPDFEKLFAAIENEYFPAIPLIALAKRIKLSLSNEYKSSFSDTAYNAGYFDLRMDEFINLGLNKSISHLNSFYLTHNKLSLEEGDLFIKALKEIAEDAKNGGINRGLYEYLSLYKPGLTKEKFQSKYYQPFEYLVRIFKKAIANEILDDRHY
jgi:hypothetical protein